MNEQSPLAYSVAAAAEARCVIATAQLLLKGRLILPRENVGRSIRFADGTAARVYRETVVDGMSPNEACALVVQFKLRFVKGWGHKLFRLESLLNTPLFAGFPGFVSKLWLTHDERGCYRGIYDWDGPARAEDYARSLWRVLELGCESSSIRYVVLPGVRRDELVDATETISASSSSTGTWWRPVA
jgi:hypothetical protein